MFPQADFCGQLVQIDSVGSFLGVDSSGQKFPEIPAFFENSIQWQYTMDGIKSSNSITVYATPNFPSFRVNFGFLP